MSFFHEVVAYAVCVLRWHKVATNLAPSCFCCLGFGGFGLKPKWHLSTGLLALFGICGVGDRSGVGEAGSCLDDSRFGFHRFPSVSVAENFGT